MDGICPYDDRTKECKGVKMGEFEKKIVEFYNSNMSWILSQYDGDLRPDTMTNMAIEWTVEDCVPLIKDIVNNYLAQKA